MSEQTTKSGLERAVDSLASDEAFGDSIQLIDNARRVLDAELVELARNYPGLRRSLERIPLAARLDLQRDPTIRAATDKVLRQEEDADGAASRLENLIAVPELPGRTSEPPLVRSSDSAIANPSIEGESIYLLDVSGDQSAHWSEFMRLFNTVVCEGEPDKFSMRPFLPRHVNSMAAAVETIYELLPELGSHSLLHMTAAAFVEGDEFFDSATMHDLPMTMFLSERAFATPWSLITAIFHEAIHLKLFDIHLLSPIVTEKVSMEELPLITAMWNPPPKNDWIFGRAVAAFHVYTHLVVLHAAAFDHPTNDHLPSLGELEYGLSEAGRRAYYLGSSILRQGATKLSPVGESLVQWLLEIVMSLDDGSFTHTPDSYSEASH